MPTAKKRVTAWDRLDWDPDRFGLIAGALCATLVMAWCFYAGHVSFLNVLFRTLVTFGVTYLAVSLLTAYFRHTVTIESKAIEAASAAKPVPSEAADPETAEQPGEPS